MRRAPLHLGHVSKSDPLEFDVIESFHKAYGFLEVAMELWRLAGGHDRASAIDDVITSAYHVKPPRLERDQIEVLRDLLLGLEETLIGTLTDEQHLLSPAKVDELRGHTETLDLDLSRGEAARFAVQEALIYIDYLRTITDKALATDASILFD